MQDRDVEMVCRAYGVPPWIVSSAVPRPRFPWVAWAWLRLRWRLARG